MSNLTGPSVQSAPTHSLLFTLPQELFETVLNYCKKKDIDELRLINKQFNIMVTPAFLCNFPTKHRFVFTKKSMQGLIGLTAHPALAPLLKTITFGTHRLESEAIHHEAQHDFILDGGPVAGMIQAMKNLQSQGNTRVTFGVYDDIDSYDYHEDIDYVECRELDVAGYAAQDSYGDCVPTQNAIVSTLKSLRYAVQVSGYPLTELDLDLFSFIDREIDLEDIFWEGSDATISIYMKGKAEKAVTKISSDKSHLIMACHDMEHERLGSDYLGMEKIFYDDVYTLLYKNPFRSLDLSHMNAPYDMFSSQIFEKSQLTDLSLSEIAFSAVDESHTCLGTAAHLCRSLKEIPTLERLTLENISDGWVTADFIQEKKAQWDGQEQIQAGLDKLISAVAGWSYDFQL
ncbi:hypothetical protein D6D06_06505 [Aureobasidium pullulans]|nr:hypothetical protein D6D06_06505 [Aureobasidium pullulans]